MDMRSRGMSKKISNVKIEDIKLLELDKDKIYLVSVKFPESAKFSPDQLRLVLDTVKEIFNKRGLDPILQVDHPSLIQIKVAEVIEVPNDLKRTNKSIKE